MLRCHEVKKMIKRADLEVVSKVHPFLNSYGLNRRTIPLFTLETAEGFSYYLLADKALRKGLVTVLETNRGYGATNRKPERFFSRA